MLITLTAALSLAASLAIDVPYLPQTDALCGGAAAAMVFRYWGDAHADAQDVRAAGRSPGRRDRQRRADGGDRGARVADRRASTARSPRSARAAAMASR